MKKSECMDKIEELLPEVEKYLRKETYRLMNAGALNLDEYDSDEYVLPKILLVAALNNCSTAYGPASYCKKYLKEIKNLRHF